MIVGAAKYNELDVKPGLMSHELALYRGCRNRESNFAHDFEDKSTSVSIIEFGADAIHKINIKHTMTQKSTYVPGYQFSGVQRLVKGT